MEDKKPEIKKGQFWLAEKGAVVLVTGRNPDDTCWLTNRLDKRGGFLEGVAVHDQNFEMKITEDTAKVNAIAILKKKVEQFFDRSSLQFS